MKLLIATLFFVIFASGCSVTSIDAGLGDNIKEVPGRLQKSGVVIRSEPGDLVETIYTPDEKGVVVRVTNRAPFPSVADAVDEFVISVRLMNGDKGWAFQRYGSAPTSYLYFSAEKKLYMRVETKVVDKIPYLQSSSWRVQ